LRFLKNQIKTHFKTRLRDLDNEVMIFDLFDLFIIKIKDNNNLLVPALLYLVSDISC